MQFRQKTKLVLVWSCHFSMTRDDKFIRSVRKDPPVRAGEDIEADGDLE